MPKKSIHSKVNALSRKIDRLGKDVEYKFRDSAQSLSMVTTGTITDVGLGLIVPGTTVSQRIGEQLTMSSLRLRGAINYGDAFNSWRYLVILLPSIPNFVWSVADILEMPNNWFNSFYKRNSTIKFKVLADKRGYINSPVATTNQETTWKSFQQFTINLKFKKGLLVKYNLAAGASPVHNQIVVLALGDSAIPSHPEIRFVSRITYTDA